MPLDLNDDHSLEEFCSGEEIHWEDIVGLDTHEHITREQKGLPHNPCDKINPWDKENEDG